MSRWEPDASGRLRRAAIELFVERGYEQTTVADIADRAGLTARTFFRYFADKREVLFDGAHELDERMGTAVGSAPPEAAPMAAVAVALDAAADMLGGRRDFSAIRHQVITANAELRERELIKMSSLSDTLCTALTRRGVSVQDAGLAAEAGVAVLRVAFTRWVGGTEPDLHHVMREALAQLRGLTAAPF